MAIEPGAARLARNSSDVEAAFRQVNIVSLTCAPRSTSPALRERNLRDLSRNKSTIHKGIKHREEMMAVATSGLGSGHKAKKGPTRVAMQEPATLGERIADAAARSIGSWRFILTQTILVAIWVGLNLIAWEFRWDPYPFILLNLMFSVQAAYTGAILLLASNRQAARDRAMAQRDDEELGVIYGLQHEQMQILSLLREAQERHTEILEMLKQRADTAGRR